jgi:hypothetical protein
MDVPAGVMSVLNVDDVVLCAKFLKSVEDDDATGLCKSQRKIKLCRSGDG